MPSPAVCALAPTEPILPEGAGIVAPATDDERRLTGAFLDWVYQVLDWGRALKDRADAAGAWCARQEATP